MISNMAMEDIDALIKDGYTVSPRDIIRLNAFGVKIQANPDSSTLYEMPRVAILNDIIFHEPTIGSEIWLSKCAKLFNMENSETYFSLLVYSLTQKDRIDPENKKELRKAVKKLLSKDLKNITIRQLQNAVMYVVYGNNHNIIDSSIQSKNKKPSNIEKINIDDDNNYAVGLVREGLIYNLGNKSEIEKMTVSEVNVMLINKVIAKYGIDALNKDNNAKYLAEYYNIIDEIKAKGKNGKN